MTDPEFADATYVEPLTPEFVEKVIALERPDALLPTLGGQTALNLAVALHESGVLEKYGVELIGADIEAIRRGEDRQRFKEIVRSVGAECADSLVCRTLEEAGRLRRDRRQQGRRPAVVHDGRARLRSGQRRRRTADDRQPGLAASPAARGSGRAESCSAGRSIELELMRDHSTTTSWSSARSRTSTRWACIPATRSPSPPR